MNKMDRILELILFYIKVQTYNSGIVIGVSGGIDSALTLALSYLAIGNERIHALIIPYFINNNYNDAIELVKIFNVKCTQYSIKNEVDNKSKLLDLDDKSKQNLMARERMTVLYSIANKENKRVIGTCNLSEILMGYETKYGDGASDFNPLSIFLKTKIYELVKYYNNKFSPKIPENIICKKPSADLFEGQTDEEDLKMSYEELDSILIYILSRLIPKGMTTPLDNKMFPHFRNFKTKDISKVYEVLKTVIDSNHKRSPIPSPYISPSVLW